RLSPSPVSAVAACCCLFVYRVVAGWTEISCVYASFCSNATPPALTYTLSLHDALPILCERDVSLRLNDLKWERQVIRARDSRQRSEEHTSELQSRRDLVCRLLLEKKNKAALRRGLPDIRLAGGHRPRCLPDPTSP